MSMWIALENLSLSINPVSWIDYLHGMAAHGKLTRLEWRDATGAVVEDTLRRYAIHGYGRGIAVELEPGLDGGQRKIYRRWLWVNAKQASWAEYVLLRAGVELISVIDPRNVAWAQQHDGEAPAPWQGGRRSRPATPVEGMLDVFGGMFGYDEAPPSQESMRRQNRSRGRSARGNR